MWEPAKRDPKDVSPPPTHRLLQEAPARKPLASDANQWDELWGAADVSALVTLVATMPPGTARAARLSQLDAAWSVMAPAVAALPSMDCAAVLSMLGALGVAPARLAAVLDETTPRAQSPFALVFPVGDLLIGRGGRREGPTVPLKRHEAHPNSFELVVRTTRSSVSFQLQLHRPLPDGMVTRTYLVPYMTRNLHHVDASAWLACGGELNNTCPVLTVATPPADQPLMFGVVVLVCPSSAGVAGPGSDLGSVSVTASHRTQQEVSSGHGGLSNMLRPTTTSAPKISAFAKRTHSAVGGAAENDDGHARVATKARFEAPAQGGGADPVQLQAQLLAGQHRMPGLTCKFHNSSSGCRLGSNCRFPHERASAPPMPMHMGQQAQQDDEPDNEPDDDQGDEQDDERDDESDEDQDDDQAQQEEPQITHTCKYFNTPKGCRSGGNCKFAHVPQAHASRAPSCTFLQTGKKFTDQVWYKCLTCHPEQNENWGLCESCRLVCHRGHRLEKQDLSPFYCDCGSERPGKCQNNGRGSNHQNEEDEEEEEADEDDYEDEDDDQQEDEEDPDNAEQEDESQYQRTSLRLCKYVNTPAGCRNGSNCRFPHV